MNGNYVISRRYVLAVNCFLWNIIITFALRRLVLMQNVWESIKIQFANC